MYSRVDILHVAANLFCEHGYHATSLKMILQSVGLRESGFHEHFRSKEDLLWAIIWRIMNLYLLQIRSISADLPVEERFTLLLQKHLEVGIREPQHVAVFTREWMMLEYEQFCEIKMLRAAYEEYFHTVLEEGIQQGVFQIPDAMITRHIVLAALQWSYPGGPEFSLPGRYHEHLAGHYEQLLLKALR